MKSDSDTWIRTLTVPKITNAMLLGMFKRYSGTYDRDQCVDGTAYHLVSKARMMAADWRMEGIPEKDLSGDRAV